MEYFLEFIDSKSGLFLRFGGKPGKIILIIKPNQYNTAIFKYLFFHEIKGNKIAGIWTLR